MESTRELELLERISTLLRSEARQAARREGLQPVQVDVVVYLGRCNRYSDTPAAVAEYLGLTKGTASQSILRLEEKGLIERVKDENDGRVSHLGLTADGRRVAATTWKRPLAAALREVGDQRGELAEHLEGALGALQQNTQSKSFATCPTCRHLEQHGARSFRCGLTQEDLTAKDRTLICCAHEFARSA